MAHSHMSSTKVSTTLLTLPAHSLSLTWHQGVVFAETPITEGDTPNLCDIDTGHGQAQQPPKRPLLRLALPSVDCPSPSWNKEQEKHVRKI